MRKLNKLCLMLIVNMEKGVIYINPSQPSKFLWGQGELRWYLILTSYNDYIFGLSLVKLKGFETYSISISNFTVKAKIQFCFENSSLCLGESFKRFSSLEKTPVFTTQRFFNIFWRRQNSSSHLKTQVLIIQRVSNILSLWKLQF